MTQLIETELADGIGRIVLNGPPLNIITRKMMGEIRAALTVFAATQSLRVLVLSATGKHFSAGADVGEHLPPEHEELIPEFVATVRALDEFPLPTVAAVQGRCLGGGFELIQPVDMVVAGESSSFGQPEIMLGVLPPAACVILPRATPRGVAAEIIFGGDAYPAEHALRAGLVLRVVPDDGLADAATELAARVARHSRTTLLLAKRAMRAARNGTVADGLAAVQHIYIDDLMDTQDALEGLASFGEKRPPVWKHV